MREIEVNGGKCQVRGLNRMELDELEKKGYPISRWQVDLGGLGRDAKANEMFDEVLNKGCVASTSIDFDALIPVEERKLFLGIIAETYGDEDEEKNLSPSGRPDQTNTPPRPAGHAK
jgi:hypothetical protein